jgi:hypothetical protein
MADSWNPTSPQTATSGGVIAKSFWDTEVRDRMDAIRAVLTGDGSVDADMWLAVKSGTLSARSSVTHKVGRRYQTTDTQETFKSDGTNWRHDGGAGAYDDFRRANNTVITPSASGHVWTEEVGDWSIASDLLVPGAGTAYATLNTGSLLDRSYSIIATFQTQATQGSIDVGIVLKYVDTNNLLYAQLVSGAVAIYVRIGGATAQLASVPFSPTANTGYRLDIHVHGKAVLLLLSNQVAQVAYGGARHDNVTHANLASAQKVGFRTPNTLERFSSIAVFF